MSLLETIEAFYVVRNAYKVARLSNFVENIINKKSYEPARAFVIYGHSWCFESSQIARAVGECNFENFQNITRAHKSRNYSPQAQWIYKQ